MFVRSENHLSWGLEDEGVSGDKCRADFGDGEIDRIVEGWYGQDNSEWDLI